MSSAKDRALFVAGASEALASSLDYERTLSTVARLAIPQFADWSAIHLRQPDGSVRWTAAAHRDPACERLLTDWYAQHPFEDDADAVVPRVLRTNRSAFHPSITKKQLDAWAESPEALERMRAIGVRSVICVPLDVDGAASGAVLFVRRAGRGGFRADDLRLAEDLGRRAAQAIEHARLHQALQEREALYEMTFEQAPVGVSHQAPDGRWLRVNERLCDLLGYTRDELLSRSFREITHPDDLPYELDLRERVLSGELTRARYEKRFVRRDGGAVAAAVTLTLVRTCGGAPDYFLAVAEDLGPLRQAERALQTEQARTAFALEAAGVGAWELDLRTGRIAASGSMAEVHGLTPEAFPPSLQAYLPLVHPDDRAALATRLEQAERASTEGRRFDRQFRIVRPDGAVRWLQVRGQVFESRSLVRGVVLDVTAQHEFEERLRHSQKLEAIGRLSTGMAHDFSNVLAAIMGYTEVMLQQIGETDPLRADLHEVQAAAERAVHLTRQLLAFGRQRTWQPEVTSLNILVSKMAALLARLLGDGVELRIQLDPAIGPVRLDQGQFEQVLMNLAINARDAMAEGGVLVVETRGDAQSARLLVRDNGIGMDAATRAKIFEPFFTTKGERGTGLGLSTVYGIVQQNGGDISVSSEPGHGTVFEIRLPVLGAPEASPGGPAVAVARSPVRTVLVVDADDAVRKLLVRLLGQQGLRAIEAAGPARALALAAELGASSVDLLITDVNASPATGFDLAANIRAILPDLPVIFMSAQTDGPAVDRLRRASASTLLEKPFTTATVLAAIERLRPA
ncbi:MAG: PAS domain S-box protein [Acidobacteriota bacterium]|nr:PAS domain S-box protein [Acidobacteriota bacterium]